MLGRKLFDLRDITIVSQYLPFVKMFLSIILKNALISVLNTVNMILLPNNYKLFIILDI